jgi:hypothetical protein
MARHSKEWNEGYQAAIEAIKKIMQGDNSDVSDNNSGSNGMPMPSEVFDKAQKEGGQKQTGNGKDKSINPDGQQGQGSGSSGGSRTSSSDPNQGVVRSEDCQSNNSGVEGTPGTPGGFFDKSEGDKLAQAEGYDKDGGSESSVEQDWKDAALRAANNINHKAGTAWGKLKAQIEGLYKVQTDWKKALKQVVGKSINDADRRQAYANKNILISQDRIARTDKDKFDNMDYMVAFIDSSGSMSDDQLKMVLSEVYSLALQKKPVKLITVQCDTKIQEIKEYTSIKDLKADSLHATVKGRGGTDVKPLWDLMAGTIQKDFKKRHKGNPDLVMIFTDGYVPAQYPRNKRLMNWLCWCILDNPSFNVQYNDNMTKVIHLKTDDIK